jgi:hypothetical protein
VYAVIRPFVSDFFNVKPRVGFSVFTIYDEFCFNAGVEAQLHILRFLFLTLNESYRDKLWRHQLGVGVNLRYVELDFILGLQSQDFIDSFKVKGFNAGFGLRFGI